MKQLVRRLIIRLLQTVGYDFDKISLDGALERSRGRVKINSVIDIGASNGMWSEKCLKAFPGARYHLIEAQQLHEPRLKQFCTINPKASYVLAAAGEKVGEINFDGSLPFGGLASETPFAENNIVVPVTTVDAQVHEQQLQPPFLLKLDTHGYEIPIFAGAMETLAQTALLVVEVYTFTVAENSLKFDEIVTYLDGLGFRPVDLCDPLHRPLDNALWQFDLFFQRKESATVSTDAY